MKARTQLQVGVMNLTKYLPDIEGKVLSWAKVDCLRHVGYATKNRVVCMDCGQKFSPELVSRKRAVCPHCSTKLVIEQTKYRTLKQDTYIAYASVYGEFQVIRNFELISYHKADKPVKYYFIEVLQHWILPTKREVIARNHTANYMCDSWGGNMEIRNKSDIQKYDIYPSKLHPDSEFKLEYRKYGIDCHLSGLTPLQAITHIPKKPICETLLKAKQYSLLSRSLDRDWVSGRIVNNWNSIKICMRNKYIVKDGGMWLDYLDLLLYFKKDLNNAFYVCPKNLKQQHDVYVKRKRKAMDMKEMKRDYLSILRHFGEEIRKDFVFPKNLKRAYQVLNKRYKLDKLEKKKKELSEMDLRYKEFIQLFIDMKFVDKELVIVPLKSIDEFKIEGDLLKHCVYSNEYFKKKDSLILSARIGDERIETIEINLKSIKLEQCRGIQNSNSKYHDRILKIISKNIKVIRSRVKEAV